AALIMPRIVGVSSCSTTCLMCRSPSAFTVASCFGESPMMLLTSVTLSLLATCRLLTITVRRAAPARVRGLQLLHAPKRVHGGLEHVVRIVRAERFREHVLNSGGLAHRAHRPAGNDARTLSGRLEKYTRGAEVPGDLARNRRVLERHEHQVFLRVLDRLPNGLRHLAGLAKPDADVTVTISDDDERREGESPATLHDLGDPVDRYHPIREIQRTGIDPRLSHSHPPHEHRRAMS